MNFRDIQVVPARNTVRDPFITTVKVAETMAAREKGFQNTNPQDATVPIILQWIGAGIRLLHNENVKFDVTVIVVDPKGYVQQSLVLKEGDKTPVMTSPTSLIIEIPETLEGIIIEPGDKVHYVS
jgi:hypothetical protein